METTVAYQVKEVTWTERAYVVKRAIVPFDKLPAFFKEQYNLLYGALTQKGIHLPPVASAFYYSIDEEKKQTDVAAALQLPSAKTEIKEMEKLILPGGKRITTTFYGKCEEMAPAYEELERYLKQKGFKKELYIEEYFSDPEKEKDPAKMRTDIYFAVK